ncbi:hypothetical protein [Pseudoalteromonas sp. T1lg23B]|uniref:hypothetical protein n=1 Tax=Pseudoalteromonas sp. T1lg23B TaxID=2077097 RepID=UPI0018FE7180|nr:hypothetical protein [Pseudoalteromonas sp. T1lg23B]
MLSLFGLLINGVFSIAFSQLGKLMDNKLNIGRHIDGLLGVIFLGLATRLATSK